MRKSGERKRASEKGWGASGRPPFSARVQSMFLFTAHRTTQGPGGRLEVTSSLLKKFLNRIWALSLRLKVGHPRWMLKSIEWKWNNIYNDYIIFSYLQAGVYNMTMLVLHADDDWEADVYVSHFRQLQTKGVHFPQRIIHLLHVGTTRFMDYIVSFSHMSTIWWNIANMTMQDVDISFMRQERNDASDFLAI